MAVSQVVIGLASGVVGGMVTLLGAVVNQRYQVSANKDTEYRLRELAASTTAVDTLSQLVGMPHKPEIVGPPATEYEAWRDKRDAHLLVLRVVQEDLRDRDLRDRLTGVHRAMSLDYGALNMIGQPEFSTRWIACTEGLDCLGAFRRGDPLPELAAAFKAPLDAIDEYEEIQEQR